MTGNLDFYIATLEDFEDIYKLIDLTGWGEARDDIKRTMLNPNSTYITVIDNETAEMIGITLAVSFGQIGVIGHVIVNPNFRGMGIGQELMNEAMRILEFQGCKTIKLDAVEKAKTLYERVGFVFELNSLRYKITIENPSNLNDLITKTKKYEQKFPVINCKEDDLVQIIEADKEFFGGNRENLLFPLFEDFPEFSFITRDKDDSLAGYLFGTFQNGVLKLRIGIADSFESTMDLLRAALEAVKTKEEVQTIALGILENSIWGIKVLKELGFEQTSYSLRMYYGVKTPATTNPEIFAIGDPAKG
ncbi:MAG: GNAT family N-acetyltransferase [Candidatus Heimdallarchaeota archaeon]|nr:GNAT family N-acetyltransferase [Candidatus Heimdallarchaeota archaeon]MCK4290083.1 GNAT family N-acetyltransferase [Candidatus Heimdallarchaeota archaeon]